MAKAKMHQQINLQNSLVSGNVIEITNFRDEKTYTWNSTNFNKRKKALQTLQVKKVFFFFEAIITMASEIKNCFGTVFNQVFFSLTERENNELGRNWNENNFLGSAWQSDNFTWKLRRRSHKVMLHMFLLCFKQREGAESDISHKWWHPFVLNELAVIMIF